MFLTPKQLVELTDKKQAAAQAKQLDFIGVTYRKRCDGSLAVSLNHVEKLFGGDYSTKEPPPKEPNWTALNSAKAA